MSVKQNWFNTLNESLESEGLVEMWPPGLNVNYDQTQRCIIKTGELKGKQQVPRTMLISIYRNERGMFERPLHYYTN